MLTSCGLPQLARSFDWAYLSLNFPLSVEHFCWLSFWYIAFTSAPALTSTTFIGVSILSEAPNIPSVFLRVGLVSVRCLSILSYCRESEKHQAGWWWLCWNLDSLRSFEAPCDTGHKFLRVLGRGGWICTFRTARSCEVGSIGQISITRDFMFVGLFAPFIKRGMHFQYFLS